MKKVMVLVATNGSNKKLTEEILELIDFETEVINLEDLDLPLFTPTRKSQGVPENALILTQKAMECDGFIFSGPEYNGSMPPIISNAIAWISTSGNKDWRAAFNGKPVQLATSSGGLATKYQAAMTQQLNHIGAVVMPRQITVNASKPFNSDSAKTILEIFGRFL